MARRFESYRARQLPLVNSRGLLFLFIVQTLCKRENLPALLKSLTYHCPLTLGISAGGLDAGMLIDILDEVNRIT